VGPRGLLPAHSGNLPQHGILFIADEVQSGIGPHWEVFASEHFGIEADLITTAKSLGGGLPLAAVTGRAEIMDTPGVGSLGGTFTGNPLLARRHWLRLKRLKRKGCWLVRAAMREALSKSAACLAESGLRSAIFGVLAACVRSNSFATQRRVSRRKETKEVAQYVTNTAYHHYGWDIRQCMRILVPLTVTDEQFDERPGQFSRQRWLPSQQPRSKSTSRFPPSRADHA